GIDRMQQFSWRRRRDQLGAEREKVSDVTATRLGRVAPGLARDEVRDVPVGVNQLDLCAALEFLAFGFQLAPGQPRVLRADQPLALGDQRPQPDHAALHAWLDDPDDARAFAVDRREHRGFFTFFTFFSG